MTKLYIEESTPHINSHEKLSVLFVNIQTTGTDASANQSSEWELPSLHQCFGEM